MEGKPTEIYKRLIFNEKCKKYKKNSSFCCSRAEDSNRVFRILTAQTLSAHLQQERIWAFKIGAKVQHFFYCTKKTMVFLMPVRWSKRLAISVI